MLIHNNKLRNEKEALESVNDELKKRLANSDLRNKKLTKQNGEKRRVIKQLKKRYDG